MARNRNLRNTHTKDTAKNTKEKALLVIDERKVLEKDFKVYGTVEEPLFVASDVALWIEHSNTTEMLKTIDDEEKLTSTILRAGQGREVNLLTEEGLYEVLFQSRKPIAKAFKKEVKAILKELRTTGGFISDTEKFIEDCFGDCPEDVKAFMKATIDQRKADKKKIVVLEAENSALSQDAVQWGDREIINALTRAYGAYLGGSKEDLLGHGVHSRRSCSICTALT